jgi:hypothetical protein
VRPRSSRRLLLPLLIAGGLGACAGKRSGTPDDEPTLRSLAGREISVQQDAGIAGSEEQAIAAYRKFLEVAPGAPQRAEAMRRLGDLEMESADKRSVEATASSGPDYRAAIASYQGYLDRKSVV